MLRWGACDPQRSHEVRLAVRAPFLAEPHLLLSPEILLLSPHTYIKVLCIDDTVHWGSGTSWLPYHVSLLGRTPGQRQSPGLWPPSVHTALLQFQFTGEKNISAPRPSLTQLTHYPWVINLLEKVLACLVWGSLVLVITVTIALWDFPKGCWCCPSWSTAFHAV